jgi:hypothetical protein
MDRRVRCLAKRDRFSRIGDDSARDHYDNPGRVSLKEG